MIAAIVLAASLVDKPFILTWSVNWGGDRNPTTHAHAFETPDEAFDMYSKAPMCGESKEPPCVIWARVSYVDPSTDDHIKKKDGTI